VHDGKKKFREKLDSLKEAGKRVVIEKLDGFTTYFHCMKLNCPGLLSASGEPIYPAIPLSSNWWSKYELKKANKVEIIFPAHSGTLLPLILVFMSQLILTQQFLDLLCFKEEIIRANLENPQETNQIPWKDASSPQEQNPGIFKSYTFK
jgi:hypothetical protein